MKHTERRIEIREGRENRKKARSLRKISDKGSFTAQRKHDTMREENGGEVAIWCF